MSKIQRHILSVVFSPFSSPRLSVGLWVSCSLRPSCFSPSLPAPPFLFLAPRLCFYYRSILTFLSSYSVLWPLCLQQNNFCFSLERYLFLNLTSIRLLKVLSLFKLYLNVACTEHVTLLGLCSRILQTGWLQQQQFVCSVLEVSHLRSRCRRLDFLWGFSP